MKYLVITYYGEEINSKFITSSKREALKAYRREEKSRDWDELVLYLLSDDNKIVDELQPEDLKY